MSKDTRRAKRGISLIYPRLIFPIAVGAVYAVLYIIFPEKALSAWAQSLNVLTNVAFPLCLVFVFMVLLNIALKPGHVGRLLGKKAGLRAATLATAAGIISAGPIYAWYPILRDLREKGASNSSLAIFLGNRAVKPFLLPVMISYFGWIYVLILTILTVLGSLAVGYVVEALDAHQKTS